MNQLAALFGDTGGSARRYLIGLPTLAILMLSNKLGLGIQESWVPWIAGVAIAMITGSNLKDMLADHLDAKVQVASLQNPAAPDAVPAPKPTVP